MEYSEEAIGAAKKGLNHLYNQIKELRNKKGKINKEHEDKFLKVVNDDLNLPQALAKVQELLKSNLSNPDKFATVLRFDKILGLNLDTTSNKLELPENIFQLVNKREGARKEKNWEESDKLRIEIEKSGYLIEDTEDGMRIGKR